MKNQENKAQHTAEWPVEMMYHRTGKLCYYVGEASSKAEERERAALIRKAPALAAEAERLREENERLKRELNAANELLNDGREGRGE